MHRQLSYFETTTLQYEIREKEEVEEGEHRDTKVSILPAGVSYITVGAVGQTGKTESVTGRV